jgi:hypothetical protein
MRTKFESAFSLCQLLLVIAVIGLLAALVIPQARAAENFKPNYYFNVLTNGVTQVTNGQTLSVNTKPFALRQGKGLAVLPYQVGTNTSTADEVYRFEVTADGTNYTTTGPLRATNALNSTTAVRGYTLFPTAALDSIRAVKLVSIQNYHTNTITVTNVVLSQSND